MGKLIAKKNIYYKGKQYIPGEEIPSDDAEMVEAWKRAESVKEEEHPKEELLEEEPPKEELPEEEPSEEESLKEEPPEEETPEAPAVKGKGRK